MCDHSLKLHVIVPYLMEHRLINLEGTSEMRKLGPTNEETACPNLVASSWALPVLTHWG